MIRRILKVVLPIVALAIGVAGAWFLASQAEAPKPEPPQESAVIVEAEVAHTTDDIATVIAHGTVKAAETQTVMAQVGGRLTAIHPQLELGAVVPADAVLIQIDRREYEASVQELTSQVSRARSDYELEKGRGRTAQREWKLLGASVPADDSGKKIALRKPQLKSARAALAGARGALERAKLNVERTTVKAPFRGLVIEESVAPDQVVSPQAKLATLVRTDAFWVELAVPLAQLSWIDIPSPGSDRLGSEVTVVQELGTEAVRRTGRVLRLVGEVDPAGRMARLLVQIDDPLGLDEDQAGLPLMLGAYVRAEISGRPVKNVVELPRVALREGARVWVVDKDNRLEVRDVEIAWRKRDSVLLKHGLDAGETYVTSRIGTPVAGMLLELTAPTPREPAADGRTARRSIDPTVSGRVL